MFRRAYYAPAREPAPAPQSGAFLLPARPAPSSWSLREYLRLLLQGKYDWIGEAPPRFSRVDHVEQAERIYRKSRLPVGCDPRWLCHAYGVDVVPRALPPDTREVYLRGRVLVPLRKGPRHWGPLVGHALVHHINETVWCGEWTHADIWLCTFELMAPAEHMFLQGLDQSLEAMGYASKWFINDYWDAVTGQL